MNVREIVITHLKSGGFDGLCCDGCDCGLDDLMACECFVDVIECVPANLCAGGVYRPAETHPNEEETHL